jgi:hypothetical protein
MLGDGKPGTLVEYVAVKKELRNRKHEMRRLGWTSAKLGPILDAACQAKVVESIGFHPTITYLTLLPPPLGLKSTTVHLVNFLISCLILLELTEFRLPMMEKCP